MTDAATCKQSEINLVRKGVKSETYKPKLEGKLFSFPKNLNNPNKDETQLYAVSMIQQRVDYHQVGINDIVKITCQLGWNHSRVNVGDRALPMTHVYVHWEFVITGLEQITWYSPTRKKWKYPENELACPFHAIVLHI